MKIREVIAWMATAYLLCMCAFISMAHPKDRAEGYAAGVTDEHARNQAMDVVMRDGLGICRWAALMNHSVLCKDDSQATEGK